mmetsp:Transcript_88477/g.205856  ORF Transcript_88477/g.205856 Transcript_88477/m.205856 type:complete len:216 (-) Transcript_88477:959-1606(-)
MPLDLRDARGNVMPLDLLDARGNVMALDLRDGRNVKGARTVLGDSSGKLWSWSWRVLSVALRLRAVWCGALDGGLDNVACESRESRGLAGFPDAVLDGDLDGDLGGDLDRDLDGGPGSNNHVSESACELSAADSDCSSTRPGSEACDVCPMISISGSLACSFAGSLELAWALSPLLAGTPSALLGAKFPTPRTSTTLSRNCRCLWRRYRACQTLK